MSGPRRRRTAALYTKDRHEVNLSTAPPLHARFLQSAADSAGLPPDRGAEVAFVGRSNSGKSSALNALAGQKVLARVSKTPGRTQLINFFALDERRRLVDLPGYGYARVPPAQRAAWGRLITHYLDRRRSLRGLVLVMDVRHPLTPLDEQLLALARATHRPVQVLLTKSDKLGGGAGRAACRALEARLAALGVSAGVQLFSAATHEGVTPARRVLARWLELTANG
jgi:GTP-binding protein